MTDTRLRMICFELWQAVGKLVCEFNHQNSISTGSNTMHNQWSWNAHLASTSPLSLRLSILLILRISEATGGPELLLSSLALT